MHDNYSWEEVVDCQNARQNELLTFQAEVFPFLFVTPLKFPIWPPVITPIIGAIHTSELDRSEIDLNPKRSECEHFLKANWDRSQIDPT